MAARGLEGLLGVVFEGDLSAVPELGSCATGVAPDGRVAVVDMVVGEADVVAGAGKANEKTLGVLAAWAAETRLERKVNRARFIRER